MHQKVEIHQPLREQHQTKQQMKPHEIKREQETRWRERPLTQWSGWSSVSVSAMVGWMTTFCHSVHLSLQVCTAGRQVGVGEAGDQPVQTAEVLTDDLMDGTIQHTVCVCVCDPLTVIFLLFSSFSSRVCLLFQSLRRITVLSAAERRVSTSVRASQGETRWTLKQ